jgi:hypothetical protein
MDIEVIAASAASLLASKAGETFAVEAAKQAWDKLRRIMSRSDDPGLDKEMAGALVTAEAAPDDDEAVYQLTRALRKQAELRPDFRAALENLVELAKTDHAGMQILVGGKARVGKITRIGNVQGNVSF